jgi:hypothetical protein
MSSPPRTTSGSVIAVLLRNYDSDNNPDLSGFIATASVMVDNVVTYATNKGLTPSSTLLERLECYLAAHYYVAGPDQLFKSKSTNGKATASFLGEAQMGLEFSPYGQMAMKLDNTGALSSFEKAGRASMVWLGTKCD